MTAVLHEEETVLRSLSRCTPPAGCPASGGAWQHAWLERLADTNEDIAMLSSLVLWNFRVELAEKNRHPCRGPPLPACPAGSVAGARRLRRAVPGPSPGYPALGADRGSLGRRTGTAISFFPVTATSSFAPAQGSVSQFPSRQFTAPGSAAGQVIPPPAGSAVP